MGLDSIEILIEAEKTFGISIPDREAEQIITVGDFYDTVWRHLSPADNDKCLSQSIFYRLRSFCIHSFGISKEQFRPDASMDEFFPRFSRRQAYTKLATAAGMELPQLILPKKWLTVLIAIGLLLAGGSLLLSLVLIIFFNRSSWWLLLPAAGMLLTGFISGLMNPLRTVISPPLVKQFALKVIVLNFGTFRKDNTLNRKEVEMVITHIIADKTGLNLDEITPEKKIADDLGID